MYWFKIINGDGELYAIEVYDQSPKAEGPTPHQVLINGEQVGHVRHDQEDGPWTLARTVLSTFSPGETHTALAASAIEGSKRFRERLIGPQGGDPQ